MFAFVPNTLFQFARDSQILILCFLPSDRFARVVAVDGIRSTVDFALVVVDIICAYYGLSKISSMYTNML